MSNDTQPMQVVPADYRPEEMGAAIEHALAGKCEFSSNRYQASRYEDGSVRASVQIVVSAEQFARWLDSDACKAWRETSIAGLRSELAKLREKVRKLENKKKEATPAADSPT
jgi:hypothetical protein